MSGKIGNIVLSLFLVLQTMGRTYGSSCTYVSIRPDGHTVSSVSLQIHSCCPHCDGKANYKNHKTSKASRRYIHKWEEDDAGCSCRVWKQEWRYYCYCYVHSHQLVRSSNEWYYVYNYYRPLETSSANMSFTEAISLSIVHRTMAPNENDTTSFYGIDYLTEPTLKSGRVYITNAKEIEDDDKSLYRKIQYHDLTKVHNSIFKTYLTSSEIKVHMYEVKIKASEVIKNAPNNISLILVHATRTFIALDLLKKNINSVSTRSCQLLINKNLEFFKTNLYHVVVALKPNELCTSDITDVAISVQVEKTLRIVGYKLTDLSVDPTNFTYTANGALIKIDRLYIHSQCVLTFIITPTNNTNGTISKFAAVFGIFTASVQVDDVWTSYAKEMHWKVYLSNFEQDNVYHIMDEITGFCFQYYNDGPIVASKTCSPFIYTDNTFKYADDTCVTVDSSYNLISGHCDRAAVIDISSGSLRLRENGKYLTRRLTTLNSTYFFGHNKPDSLVLEKIFNSGLQTESTKVSKETHHCRGMEENVSFMNNLDVVYYCSPKSSGPNCASKSLTTGELKTYPENICLIIGLDTSDSTIVGLNFNGKIIRYDNVERISYVDVMEPWELVKTRNTTMIGQVYEEKDLFYNPSSYTINDVDYNLTYSGLQRLPDRFYVMYWMTGRCGKYVAKLKSDSFESCLAIKNACPSAASGWYWLHGRAGSHVLQGYCEMNTDGGGWLLFVNYTLSDGQHFVINKTDDLNEMLKPLSYPTSKVGLKKLLDWYVPFTSMRLYCFTDKPGRTLHFKTLNNNIMIPDKFVKYLSGDGSQVACLSYKAFQDDNSLMLKSCSEWLLKGNNRAYWGDGSIRQERLYVLLVQRKDAQWNFGHGESSVCDSLQSDYNYGE